jgi:hypothetical protein
MLPAAEQREARLYTGAFCRRAHKGDVADAQGANAQIASRGRVPKEPDSKCFQCVGLLRATGRR